MRPGRLLGAFGVSVALGAALSCGEVPTLPDGVAYISGVVSPSLAVAAGDTLRDSTGRVAPLRVDAFDRDGKLLSGIAVRFLVTSLDTGVRIDDATHRLVASDSVRPVRLLGQVIDRLQTPEFTVQVVPQPDSLQAHAANDSIKGDPTFGAVVSSPLEVTVSGLRKGTRVAVPYIVVRYEITRVVLRPGGESQPDSVIALLDDNRRFNLRTPRVSVDTTATSPLGVASRRVRTSIDAFDSVYVTVTATDLKGRPLKGDSTTFALVRGF
jgi:hypothetical protein